MWPSVYLEGEIGNSQLHRYRVPKKRRPFPKSLKIFSSKIRNLILLENIFLELTFFSGKVCIYNVCMFKIHMFFRYVS